jgi:hypothetical protein
LDFALALNRVSCTAEKQSRRFHRPQTNSAAAPRRNTDPARETLNGGWALRSKDETGFMPGKIAGEACIRLEASGPPIRRIWFGFLIMSDGWIIFPLFIEVAARVGRTTRA